MRCPVCGSENVSATMMAFEKPTRHGCLWWLLIGWWWLPFKWLCFTVPAFVFWLIAAIRGKPRVLKTVWVCQSCGHRWFG